MRPEFRIVLLAVFVALVAVSQAEGALYLNRCWDLSSGRVCFNGTNGSNVLTGLLINYSDIFDTPAAGGYDLDLNNETDTITITDAESLRFIAGRNVSQISVDGNNITIDTIDTTGAGDSDTNETDRVELLLQSNTTQANQIAQVNTTSNIQSLGFTTGSHTTDTNAGFTQWRLHVTDDPSPITNNTLVRYIAGTGMSILNDTTNNITFACTITDTNETDRVELLLQSNTTQSNEIQQVNDSANTHTQDNTTWRESLADTKYLQNGTDANFGNVSAINLTLERWVADTLGLQLTDDGSDLMLTANVGGTNSFLIETTGTFIEIIANPGVTNDYLMIAFEESQGADTVLNIYEGGTGHNRWWNSGSTRIGGEIGSNCDKLTNSVDCDTPTTGADLVVQHEGWFGGGIFVGNDTVNITADGDINLTGTIYVNGAALVGDNTTWSETLADTLYAPISVVDTNTLYSNLTGLNLTPNGNFSIKPTYALPQACDDGEIPEYNVASAQWDCGTDDVGGAGGFQDINITNGTNNISITDPEILTLVAGRNVSRILVSGNSITFDTIDTDTDTDTNETDRVELLLQSNATQEDQIAQVNASTNSHTQDNTTWNETYADTLYAPIGGGGDNTTWNESYANTLYADISVVDTNETDRVEENNATLTDRIDQVNASTNAHTQDNTSWSETLADTLYCARGDWTTHDNYPAACGGTEVVRGLADTLTCIDESTLTSGDTTQFGGFTTAYYLNTTGFDAANITTGEIPDARISNAITVSGGTIGSNTLSSTTVLTGNMTIQGNLTMQDSGSNQAIIWHNGTGICIGSC